MQGNIAEIFSSVQGEGKYAGCRQLFLRFVGWNLPCRVETVAGSQEFREIPNTVTSQEVRGILDEFLASATHQALAITGGEPLLYADFIAELCKNLPVKVMLETNGTLHEELEKVLQVVDIISMDIKFPSAVGRSLWENHRRFMELAKERDLYIKLVVTGDLPGEEFAKALALIKETAPNAPVVLQPVTPVKNVQPADPKRMLELQQFALEFLQAPPENVRVIPQTHRMMNLL